MPLCSLSFQLVPGGITRGGLGRWSGAGADEGGSCARAAAGRVCWGLAEGEREGTRPHRVTRSGSVACALGWACAV